MSFVLPSNIIVIVVHLPIYHLPGRISACVIKLDQEETVNFLQASVQVYAKVMGKVQHHMALFGRDALATALSIPPQLLTSQVACEGCAGLKRRFGSLDRFWRIKILHHSLLSHSMKSRKVKVF